MGNSFVQAEQQRGTQISSEIRRQPAPRASSSCRTEEQARCAQLSTHPSPSVAKGKNYHGSSPVFKPGKWFSMASTWCWGGMDTASLVHLQTPPAAAAAASPHRPPSTPLPRALPGPSAALGHSAARVSLQGRARGVSPPPPHLVAVGAVALAEDHDAVGCDEGPHAELQPVPVRERGLCRRRRHGGPGAFPAAAALTLSPGRARPFRSGQRDGPGRPTRRARGGTTGQGGLCALRFTHRHYKSL